jgi:hypothetical protein
VRAINRAGANDTIAVVEHDRLPVRETPNRLEQLNMNSVAVEVRHGRNRYRMSAHLRHHGHGLECKREICPRGLDRLDTNDIEPLGRTHHYSASVDVDVNDVTGLTATSRITEAEPTALTDSERVSAGVLPEHFTAVDINNLTGKFAKATGQECRSVPVRNKADVMAVGLLRSQ